MQNKCFGRMYMTRLFSGKSVCAHREGYMFIRLYVADWFKHMLRLALVVAVHLCVSDLCDGAILLCGLCPEAPESVFTCGCEIVDAW